MKFATNYWLDYLRRNRLRILMYHSISQAQDRMTVQPEQFAAQMDYLAQNCFRVVSLREALRLVQTSGDLRRTIVLTFDDGYHDFLTTAVPVLQQYSYPATLYVVTGLLGKTSVWSSFDKSRRLLALDDLRQIKALGFTLGSHTTSHQDLTTLGEDSLRHELHDSRAMLADVGENFFSFCYPGGRFSSRECNAVMQAGYECAVIVGGRGGNGCETDRFLLKREQVLNSDSLDWFKRRVNGYYEVDYIFARLYGIQTR